MRSFLVPEIVTRQAWCLYFGNPGNDLGRFGAPWEAKRSAEGTPWGLEYDFIDFGWISGTILKAFPTVWGEICVFLLRLFSGVFFTISWSESGRVEFEKQAFGVSLCAKSNFSQVSGSC